MLDGNETKAAVSGARIANESGTRVLYDCDGRYPEYEKLLPLTDIMIPSEDFALAVTGLPSAEDAAVKLFSLYDPEVVVVTQGKNGGIMFDGKDLLHYPVFPADVVDTNGAGDVFHGAFAVGLLKKYDFYKCCLFASAVSALKCRGIGARENAPVFETVKEYMKENGYELSKILEKRKRTYTFV